MGREQVSFEWLLEKPCDAWFRPQIHDCVRECVRAKREEYELRFPTAPEAESVPQAVDEPGSSEKPGNAEMIKTPALSRDQSRLTACPPRGITEGAMADSNFWKERSAEFLTDAIRFADLSADWKAYSGVWTLWWGSTLEPEGIRIPPEVLAALNETSRKAVIGLPGSSTSGNQEPWRLWLELMRKGNWRGFVHMGNCSVSEKVWEAGVKIGRPPVDVRRELQLSTFDEPEADHWLKDLRLDKVFRESAKFCDDLASVLGLAAPGAQWVTTGNPTLDQPSEKVDPDALKRPQGEVGAAQPRPATGSRDANAPSDEVISSGSGLATPCQPMETVNNSHPGPASDGGPKALDEPCASDKPRTAEMIAVPATDAEMRKERHARRDGYKSECKRHGVTVTDLMIAEAASSNWHSRTAIQKWLTCDPRYDGEPDRLIRSVFAKKPHIPPKP